MLPHIIFKEEGHQYILTKTPEISPISGTKFVGNFQEPFDSSYWLVVKACQALIPDFDYLKRNWEDSDIPLKSDAYLEYLMQNVDPESLEEEMATIKARWDAKSKSSSESGTEYHLEKELASYKRGWELNPFDGKKYNVIQRPPIEGVSNYTIKDNLSELEDGYYPELLVYFEKIVGQADKVFIGTDKFGRYVDIVDIKTFEKLSKRGFYDKQARTYSKFLAPIEYIEDCNFNKTALQTSTYSWCLEQWGFQPRYSALEHFDKIHELPYCKKEVEEMYNVFPW
jgi:hypothetical protein